METFSVKISDVESGALDELSNRWATSRAETARRAIQLAHSVTFGTAAQSSDYLQQIIDSQKCTITLLKEITMFEPLISRINRLEEYAVQACISSGYLAKQAGHLEAIRCEYSAWKQNKEGKK